MMQDFSLALATLTKSLDSPFSISAYFPHHLIKLCVSIAKKTKDRDHLVTT